MNAVKRFVNERLGLRTAADLRNLVYVSSPYIVTILVGWNVTSEGRAKLIAALVAAVFGPALAFSNTTDGFRKWIYGILMPLQSLLVGFGVATESQISPIISAAVALFGGALASTNTPVSTGPVELEKTVNPVAEAPLTTPAFVCGPGR